MKRNVVSFFLAIRAKFTWFREVVVASLALVSGFLVNFDGFYTLIPDKTSYRCENQTYNKCQKPGNSFFVRKVGKC
jgi:hypothetical protein